MVLIAQLRLCKNCTRVFKTNIMEQISGLLVYIYHGYDAKQSFSFAHLNTLTYIRIVLYTT